MKRKSGFSDIKGKEYATVFLLGLFYVFVLLVFTGALTSGYHFLDDHEIILMDNYFKNGTYDWKIFFHKGLFEYFKSGIRFRPIYDTVRLLRVFLLETNFTAWSIWVGLEVVCSIVAAWAVSRKLGANNVFAILTGILIVTGQQSEIWWRLGPQEPTGLLLFLLCLMGVLEYERTPGSAKGITAVVFAFLMAASKEAFTICLPAVGLFAMGCDFKFSGYENLGKGILASLKKNWGIFLCLFVNFLVNMYVIIFKVGLLSIGYAGVDMSEGIEGYLQMFANMLRGNTLRRYICIQVLVIVILTALGYLKRTEGRRGSKNSLLLVLSFLFIMAIESFLYAKSGMYGRYLVPFTVGFCLLNITYLPGLFNSKKASVAYGIVLFLTVMRSYTSVWSSAEEFTRQGQMIGEGFETIKDGLQREDIIVTCLDRGGELDYSFAHYAKIVLNMENVYCLDQEDNFLSLYRENPAELKQLEDAGCVVVANGTDLQELGLNEDNYSWMASLYYGDIWKK